MIASDRCTRDSISFNSKASVRGKIRGRIRDVIEGVLDEELEAALGASRHEWTDGRAGYRNGTQRRTVVTERGPTELDIPRGRLFTEDGGSEEWRSDREHYPVVYLDAMRLPIRMAGRVVKVPVQAVLGVKADGQKVLISLRIAARGSRLREGRYTAGSNRLAESSVKG